LLEGKRREVKAGKVKKQDRYHAILCIGKRKMDKKKFREGKI